MIKEEQVDGCWRLDIPHICKCGPNPYSEKMKQLTKESKLEEYIKEWSHTKFAKEYFIVQAEVADWWLEKISSYASFIEGEVKESKKGETKRIWYGMGFADGQLEIKRKIEGMYKNTDEGILEELPGQLIYNQALDDVLALLTNPKEIKQGECTYCGDIIKKCDKGLYCLQCNQHSDLLTNPKE